MSREITFSQFDSYKVKEQTQLILCEQEWPLILSNLGHFFNNYNFMSWGWPMHGLSQQGVWVSFWTPKPLKSTTKDTQISWRGISWNINLKLIIDCFHLHMIPMNLYKDNMPYFDKFIHVYGWNLSILWSTFKIWMPKNFTIANFRHPVSKFWLRPWAHVLGKYWQSRVMVVHTLWNSYQWKIKGGQYFLITILQNNVSGSNS